ncbi:MAG: T9SS type A sorting domain-containing protein [Bacteroidales bacterium]|nr:T9SS type A sorting domain-containing protein [Bacteroidales bacterium]
MFRKTIKLLTLAVMVFVGVNANAQITEIKTWENMPSNVKAAHYCPGSVYFFSRDAKTLYIYDSNLVEHAVAIELGQTPTEKQSGYLSDGFSIYCLSRNLFTNSGKYEFILRGSYYIYDNTKESYLYKQEFHGIYNEDGKLVYDLGEFLTADDYDYNYIYGRDPFICGNKLYCNYSQTKDSIYTGNDGMEHTVDYKVLSTKVFQLAGTSDIKTISQQQNTSKLYPNPAKQSVTLEYDIQGQMQEMQIVDMQGRVVANYLLDPSQKQVRINTSDYKKGVYIYRYGNASGKFVVK